MTPRALAIAPALSLTLIACGNQNIVNQYHEMRPAMARGDWETASAQLIKAKEKVYGEKDRVMYWLNLGLVMHYAHKATESNENLVNAEKAMEDLWTTSISSEASKLVVNETMQSYPGEDFEKVILYYYTSLNNVELGKMQDALVEARRADELLKKMEVYYDKEGNVGTIYKQDAFMLWLVGAYYEMGGHDSLNDAYLAYKAAYKSYKEDYAGHYGTTPPKYLGEDLVRTATMLGFNDDAAKFKSETGASGETVQKLGTMGELIVLHANGESPSKRELRFNGTMPDGYVMSICVPEFVETKPRIDYAEIMTDGNTAKDEMAEPLRNIVLKNFEHRLPAIKTRAIARAIIKYAATKGAQAVAGGGNSTAGALVGLVGNVAAAATEAADLRSWNTLPAEIRVGRMWLPPGAHTVQISYHDGSGNAVGKPQSFNVEIAAGQRKLISVRSMD